MKDQAEKLRQQIYSHRMEEHEQKKTKVITVCSGKGGVGKSNFSINFALGLIEQSKKVMIFDVDLGLANIDVLLGIPPKKTLRHLVEQQLSIWDVVEKGPNGLLFVAGGSGFQHLFQWHSYKLSRLFDELSTLQGELDYIILDTGAGLSDTSLRFILAADDVIIVTTPEPTALTDAYAVLKMIHYQDQQVSVKLLINRCSNQNEGKSTAQKLQAVAKQFLNKRVDVLGYIKDDSHVMKAVKKQSPFFLEYPKTDASESIRKICISYLKIPQVPKRGLGGFLRRVFQSQ